MNVRWLAPGPRADGTPGDNGEAITSYRVTASTGATVTASTTNVDFGCLVNGNTYTFTVVAVNGIGAGAPSSPSAPVAPGGRPFPPVNVTATAGNASAIVKWELPPPQPDGVGAGNGRSLTGFTISSSPDGRTATALPSEREALVNGLANGTVYTFTVTANSALGSSDPSISSNNVIPSGPPSTPTNVTATARNGYAIVEWTPSNENGAWVSYVVLANPGPATKSTASSSTVVSGLTNGQEYTFVVTASNSAGTSGPSLPSNPVTPQSVVPPPGGAGCQTSTLPAPPGEVRLASGAVQMRIDVPCISGYGKVRMGFFIMDEEVRAFPGGPVVGDGDGRGFDPNMTPEENRIYIEVDYTSGTGYVQSNRSCKNKNETDCKEANSLSNAFSSFFRPDGSVSIDFTIGNSIAEDTHFLEGFKDFWRLRYYPDQLGGLCEGGCLTLSRY